MRGLKNVRYFDIRKCSQLFHNIYEVRAQCCSNGTYQLRLRCEACDTQTQGAIAWEAFGAEIVTDAVAYMIQHEHQAQQTLVEKLTTIDWV